MGKQKEVKMITFPDGKYLQTKDKQLSKLWKRPVSQWPKKLFPEALVQKMEMKGGQPFKG